MARKPAHLELVGGKGPRQRVWEAIRRLAVTADATFTEADIWDATEGAERDIETGMIRDYRRGLVNAGILVVVRLHGNRRTPAAFRLAVDLGAEAPRLRKDGTPVTMGLAQEQMWRTLRMLKGDTNARELAAHASTPQIPVNIKAAGDYLRNLHLASYLQCVKPGKPGARATLARYRLVSNTGPRPPMVCRTDAIYDPNLAATVWIRPVTEESAIYGT